LSGGIAAMLEDRTKLLGLLNIALLFLAVCSKAAFQQLQQRPHTNL